jgi:hypothetical protein
MTRSLTICAVLILAGSAIEAAEPSGLHISIADSIEREAVRLSQSPSKPTRQDNAWAPVRLLKPATEILVSTRSSPLGRRYFLSADQTTLNVLDLSSVALSGDPIDRLLKMAALRPDVFVNASTGQPAVDGPLEIQSGTVSYKGRVIGSMAQLVETTSREDVTTIERPAEGSVSAGTATVVGAIVAGVIGGIWAGSKNSPDASAALGVVLFAPIGAGVGFVAGSVAESNSKRPVVIYRK